jgi:competence protein ComEC
MQEFFIPIWKKAIFFRILLFFITGIVTQRFLNLHPFALWTSFIFISSLFFLVRFLPYQYQLRLRIIPSFIVFTAIVLTGMLLLSMSDPRTDKSYFGNKLKKENAFIVTLKTEPKYGEKQIRFIAEVNAIRDDSSWKKATGKIGIKFKLSDSNIIPTIGSMLVIKKAPQKIIGNKNPGGFQADEYNETKGVFHQMSLTSKDFRKMGTDSSIWLRKTVLKWRDQLLHQLQQALPSDKKVIGIAEALLIGYQEDLDPELMQAYSRTGVVHIIAISGLHVGIIYAVLWWILGNIPFMHKRTWIKCLSILIFLWIFTLVSGASPSVLRSTVMFSVLLIGKPFDKKLNAFSALLLSAFILLVYDPYLLWNLGFQLSYIAVTGILFLQKPIHSFIKTKYKAFHPISEMISVTLAAQLATMPVTLFYFHQFPNYFLIANLIAVPLSTIILFLEIGMILTFPFKSICLFLGKITSCSIRWMNTITETIDAWPYSNVDAISFSLLYVVLMYGLIILSVLVLTRPKRFYFFLLIIWFSLSSIAFSINKIKSHNQIVFIVPHQFEKTALFFLKGKKLLGFTTMKSKEEDKRWVALQKGISTTYQLNNTQVIHFPESKNLFLEIEGKRILLVVNNKLIYDTVLIPSVDFLILSENPRVEIKKLFAYAQPSKIIFTASNSKWNIERWEKELDSLPLRNFSIASQGAFIQ